MAVDIVADPETSRNLDARRKLARLEVYRRAGRIGRGPTRAYVVAYTAWRVADVPIEPDPNDYGMAESVARAWRLTTDLWIDEVSREQF